MKKIQNNLLILGTITAVTMFNGCSGGGGGSALNTTYTGVVDLAPIYKMLVHVGTWDGNTSNLPSYHTFTDVNGSYTLSAPSGSTLIIEPIPAITTVISSSDDVLSPTTASAFSDKYFKATTSATNAYINMDDTKKALISNLNANQLWSLYRATDELNITKQTIFDENTTLEVAQMLAYKEARDAQDFALKSLLTHYVIESNNTVHGDVVLSTAQKAAIDSGFTTYITQSWLEASKDNNISVIDENVIKGVAQSVISKYNAQSTLIASTQIPTLPAHSTELIDYSAFVAQSIGNKILNNADTNESAVYQDAKKVYAGVVSNFGNVLKNTASTIDQNLTKSQQNKIFAPLLFNAYVDGFVN